jgi:succinate dehydrogenase/fumarate reductase flavoprotein subunit
MPFKAYMENIQAKTGKSPEEFWKDFVKRGKIVAKEFTLI